ncbi:equilibrative nucleoside transporter 1-like [Ylistrum balloti]|uniref:equilibrative nucleoside transporter 1-like n=1 Tax=Ylistrum balloti TaxID=509963 RepID=UPI002905871A|nr:equilibrative nucleoside transporter 1-like [Ylistrum balloti]
MTRDSYNVNDGKCTNGTTVMNSQYDEKEKFLPPVKVEPGLDSINKNPDDLELNKEDDAPKDRYRIVFFIMLIHGIGILMPWNMLINAKSYFEDYKLSKNTTEVNELRSNFMFYLGIASQVPNFIMSGINTFCHCGGGMPSSRRIVIAISLEVVLFIITVILAMVDSTDWSREFFYITMLTAVFLNMATGVYQNSAFGLAAILPMKYTNAIVLGNNLSGVFIAVVNLLASAGAPDPKIQAIYYFVVAIVILLVALDAYFLLPNMKFYKHYKSQVTAAMSNSESPSSSSFSQTMGQFKNVFIKIKVQAICVWFVFFVTLSIFPAIWSNVKRIDFPLSDGMFVGIFCFLSFNLFAVLGNLTSEFIKVPGPKYVWVPILLRGLLIPYFLFCNFQPGTGRTLAVLIESDYAAIFGGVILAFTSGYYSSLVMMYGPKLVEPEVAGKAGMIMAFCLVTGITTGVAFSFLLSVMVSWG